MQNQDETIKTTPEPSKDDQQTDHISPENSVESTPPQTFPLKTIDQQNKEGKPVQKGKGWQRWVGLGLVIFLLVVVIGGAGGYGWAIYQRVKTEQAMISTAVYDQFLLGIVNMEREEYELARQRFEYILQLDPNHSEAVTLLTEALLHLGESSEIPTPRPIPTAVPTLDTRGQEEIFNNALALRDIQDWDNLINTLDNLRISDPTYKSIEVDGLYYIAYRNRGIRRIGTEGNLEGGIFDLTRAEAFGPLDIEANNFRTWGEKYLTGVSFWGLDWNQVLVYFNELAISAPYLSDSSYLTSLNRQATAQVELYSQYLITAGYRFNQGKYCQAYDLYSEASIYIALDASSLQNFEVSKNQCLGIPPTEAPQDTPTP
jgi:tetratricopeptide (TPR) repeat protein